tara:strand:- start:6138 stop:6746 length:609 start_codon:yes stop_codon:yes gene_type:complete
MKIGFFIEPDPFFTNYVNKEKKLVKKIFGNQTFLSHLPHITLYVSNFYKSDLLKIIKKIKKNKLFKSHLRINIYGTHIFYNDKFSNGNVLIYRVKKSQVLQDFQSQIIKIFHKKRISKKSFKKDTSFLNNNIIKFGYPFVGNIWIPHLTVCSLRNNYVNQKYVRDFLKKKINYSFISNNIKIYKIMNDKHILIDIIKFNEKK